MDALTTTWIIVLVIAIAVVAVLIIWVVLRASSKKRAGQPSHIELYFNENFRNLVDEWDLVSRSKIKSWRSDITKRLNGVGNDIERLKVFQRAMDKRIGKLNREIITLEKF